MVILVSQRRQAGPPPNWRLQLNEAGHLVKERHLLVAQLKSVFTCLQFYLSQVYKHVFGFLHDKIRPN